MRAFRKVSFILILAMLVSIISPLGGITIGAAALGTNYFTNDFNLYDGSQTTAVKPTGMGISNFIANTDFTVGDSVYYGEGANSIKFVSNTDGKYLQMYKSFATPITAEKVAFQAKVRLGDTLHERRIFDLNKGGASDPQLTLLTFKPDGKIQVCQSVDLNKEYAANQWYDIRLNINNTTRKLELYINNERMTEADSIELPSNWAQITYMRVGQKGVSGTEGIMNVDDVMVYDYTEDAPSQTQEPSASPSPTPVATPAPSATPSPSPVPTQIPGVVEYMNSKFDNYIGPTVSSGGSVRVDDMKAFNVVNGINYVTDAVVEGKAGKSLKIISSAADPSGKALNLSKENFSSLLTGNIVLEANIFFEDTTHQRDAFLLRNIGNVAGQTPLYATLFSFTADGTIKLNGIETGLTYESGKWYKIGAIVNNEAGTVNYYIDGNKLTATDAEKLPDNWGSIFSFKFTQVGIYDSLGIMYLDDIRAYSGTIFSEEQTDVEVPVSAVIDGWDIRYLSGSPSAEEDLTQNLVSDKSIKLTLPTAADKVSLTKEVPITGGKTYVVDAWIKVSTQASIKVDSIVFPRKNHMNLTKNGQDIKYFSHNNARGVDIENEWVRVRTYFEAPQDADSIQIVHNVPGSAVVLVASVQVEERPEWQDVIGKFSSSDISHPIQGDITKMFLGWQWTPVEEETDETRLAAVAPLMNMSEQELITAAQNNAKTRQYLDIHPEYEAMARRMAMLYIKTGDEGYARRAILIMNEFAKGYGEVPKLVMDNDIFHAHGKYIPMDCVYGYDLIYNSPEWSKLEKELGQSVKSNIEGWFRSSFMNLYNIHNDVYYSNITPYGIRNAMGLAVVLNDPDIIRLMIPWIDTMLSGRQFHADGMWQEGAISYGKQVVNNINEALNLLEACYKDPDEYVDTKFRLKLNHTNLTSRWPMLTKSLDVGEILKFPNGSTIGIHDSWTKGQRPGEEPNKATDPILPQYLKNIELWHFGHFGLTYGDEQDATQVNMTFPPISEGLPYAAGHYHGNHLGITLWGAGMEMLPDSGYPKGANRYFNMDTQSHNTAWVWNKDAQNYKDRESYFTRPSMLAYDPGDRSNKQVQLIEASSPGPVGDLTEMKRRLLLMVKTQGNKSYVLDLQRLKGGQAHELFMHAVEEEDTDLSTSLELKKYDGYTLDQYMKETGHEEGLSTYRSMFTDPNVASGSDDFKFTWKGQESGSSIQAFMNGIEGSEAIFSRAPTNRRTQNDNTVINDFPGWHFYRRNLVNPDEVTKFGAVYETYRENQQPVVQSVYWKGPDQADPMSTVAIVDMGNYIDMVYISDDTTERETEGIKFAGKTAILRKDKLTGKFVWGYVYGEGYIDEGDFKVKGEKDLVFNAVETGGTLDGSVLNTIKIDGTIPENTALNGVWLRSEFGDKSGFGLRIEGVNGNVINVHDNPAYEVTPEGAKMTFFPSFEQPETGYLKLHAGDQQYYEPRVIPGAVKVEIRQPSFKVFSTNDNNDENNEENENAGNNQNNNEKPKEQMPIFYEKENGNIITKTGISEVTADFKDGRSSVEISSEQSESIQGLAKKLLDTVKLDEKNTNDKNSNAKYKPQLTINITSKESTDNLEVKMPVQLLRNLGGMGIKDVELKSGIASLKIDPASLGLENLLQVSVTLKRSVKKLTPEQKAAAGENPVYDISIKGVNKTESYDLIGKPGSEIAVSIPYEAKGGEDLDKITVFDVNKYGQLVNKAAKYDEATKMITFKAKALSSYFIKYNDISFDDVSGQHWAEKAIETMASKGVLNGMPDGSFKPEAALTRAEFVTMLSGMLDILDKNAVAEFNDLDSTQWHYQYIASALKAGIVKGNPDGTFKPDETISRQDMCVILSRVLSRYYGEQQVEHTNILGRFSDKNDISSYAENDIAMVVKNGIISGKPGDILESNSTATRAEAATVIYKLFNQYK